jgi:phosphoglycolate phosphatase-like HAD superfamily hydrolase
MKPKLIIYDFDGVICDSVNVKTQAFAELYKSHGKEIQDQVISYHLEHGGISRFEKIRYFQETLLQSPASEEKVQELAGNFTDMVKEKVIASMYINGAKEFIQQHADICEQYICTGTPEVEIIEIIHRRGLTSFFKGVYGSPKTKTQIINEILSATGYKAEESVFLGDAMTDYKAAKVCGMPFIGIKSNDTVFPEGTFVLEDFNDKKLETFLL